MSSCRIYVGHLPYKARERDVEEFFSRYGKIREILLKNGFGFVEFDDPRDAEEAVYRCNGKELRGERVIVEMTKRPPKGRDMYRSTGRFGPYGGGGGGGRPNFYRSPPRRRDQDGAIPTQTRYRVIVENLSSRISWQDLKDIMRAAGEVTYADAHRIRPNEGIVCYRRAEDLKKALETLDGKEVNGRKIKLIDATRDSRHRSRTRSGSRTKSSRSRSSSRSKSRSKSKSKSRSRSASSKSSKSRSRSRSSRSRSKSGSSRSRSGSARRTSKKSDKGGGRSQAGAAREGKEKESSSKKRSRSKDNHSRSDSNDRKRAAYHGPAENGGKSDADGD